MKILLLLLGFPMLSLFLIPDVFGQTAKEIDELYETMRPQLIKKLDINDTELKALDNRISIGEFIKLETREDLDNYFKDNLVDFSSPYFDIEIHQKDYFQMTDEEKAVWDKGKRINPEFGSKSISQMEEQFNDLVSQCERMKKGENIPLNEQYLDQPFSYKVDPSPETNCKGWAHGIVPIAPVEAETSEEYTNYTNTDVLKVKFKYPSNWEIEEQVSRFVGNPSVVVSYHYSDFVRESANEISEVREDLVFKISKIEYDAAAIQRYSTDLVGFANDVFTTSANDNSQTLNMIEKPSMTTIGGKNASTDLLSAKPIGLPDKAFWAEQNWYTVIGQNIFHIKFNSFPADKFDSSKVTEIRNNIITSVEFLP
jgi:hypothetical protein